MNCKQLVLNDLNLENFKLHYFEYKYSELIELHSNEKCHENKSKALKLKKNINVFL